MDYLVGPIATICIFVRGKLRDDYTQKRYGKLE